MEKRVKSILALVIVIAMLMAYMPLVVFANYTYTITLTVANGTGYTLSKHGDNEIAVTKDETTQYIALRPNSNGSGDAFGTVTITNATTATIAVTDGGVGYITGGNTFTIKEGNNAFAPENQITQDKNFTIDAPSNPSAPGNNTTIHLEFDNGTINGSTITIPVNNTNVTFTYTGTNLSPEGHELIGLQNDIKTLKLTFANNFDTTKYEAKLVGPNQYSQVLAFNNKEITFSNLNLPEGVVHFSLNEKGQNNGNENQQPIEHGLKLHTVENGTATTAKFTYKNTGEEPADFWLNGTEIAVGEPPEENKAYGYVYDSQAGTVTFDFGTFVNNRITSVKINGTDYTNQLPKTKAEWLEANQNQIDVVGITVPYATTYNIETTTTRNFDWSIGNFLWSYLDQDKDSDDYIGNGKLEFVSLKFNGTTYDSLEKLKQANKSYLYFEGDDREGGAVLPAGAELTVKLVPKAGYQLVEFSCNGQKFETQAQVGYYKFTVPPGNFHWGAKFEKVEDAVKTKSSTISSGTISLDNHEKSMEIGTARLDVTDKEMTSAQEEKFKDAARKYEVADYLDISLYNTVYKGTRESSWDTEVDVLEHPATITLKLDESTSGDDIIIVHEKHDGTYEVIATQYDEDTKTISFETDSFSNYAIATRTKTMEEKQQEAAEIEAAKLLAKVIAGEEVPGMSKELAEKIVKAMQDGKEVTLEVTTPKVDEKNIPENDVILVKEKIGDKEVLVAYYDIDIVIKINGEVAGTITELENKIKVGVPAPTDLPKVADGYERKFIIVRVHDGVAEEIEATLENGYIVFNTDKFSTYALTYKDVKSTSNPKTGDNIVMYVAIFTVAVVGISIVSVKQAKNKKNKKH